MALWHGRLRVAITTIIPGAPRDFEMHLARVYSGDASRIWLAEWGRQNTETKHATLLPRRLRLYLRDPRTLAA